MSDRKPEKSQGLAPDNSSQISTSPETSDNLTTEASTVTEKKDHSEKKRHRHKHKHKSNRHRSKHGTKHSKTSKDKNSSKPDKKTRKAVRELRKAFSKGVTEFTTKAKEAHKKRVAEEAKKSSSKSSKHSHDHSTLKKSKLKRSSKSNLKMSSKSDLRKTSTSSILIPSQVETNSEAPLHSEHQKATSTQIARAFRQEKTGHQISSPSHWIETKNTVLDEDGNREELQAPEALVSTDPQLPTDKIVKSDIVKKENENRISSPSQWSQSIITTGSSDDSSNSSGISEPKLPDHID